MHSKNLYEILGLTSSASFSDIKKAYIKLAKKYHPDCNKGNKDSEQKFKDVVNAYDILKDSKKRALYDRVGHDAFFQQGNNSNQSYNTGFSSSDVNDIFGDFFSDFMGGGSSRSKRSSSKKRGSDLKYSLSISLEEAFRGVNKTISFVTDIKCKNCAGVGTLSREAMSTCHTCRGSGVIRIQQGFFTVEQTCTKCDGEGMIISNPCVLCNGYGRVSKKKEIIVTVPSGIENNTRLKIHGEGECGVRGANSGDLYVDIGIDDHRVYKIDGSDLHCTIPLIFTKAALGGVVNVSTIDGTKVALTIPPGTETGDKLRLRGYGMSRFKSSSRGDLYVHAYIKIPKSFSAKQKELLNVLDLEFSTYDAQGDNKDKSFFSKMKSIWS